MSWAIQSWLGWVAALSVLAPSAGHAEAERWPEPYYDPKPADADFVLPLPCAGAMVFRPVDVAVDDGPLKDRAITLGEPQGNLGYLEFVRTAFLSAPFPGGPSARRYWIGKYDVTRDQYTAMTGGKCSPPSAVGRIPVTNISWLDAVNAAASWSSWLLANARDRLPRRGDYLGYARLPTEDEWEYAARGGVKVSEEEFLGRTWPMPEGVEQFVMAGTTLTNGRAQQIGRARPNPLGLYDMLGNVDQMMLEPFRLNRIGRAHGQAGGIVARGGNYTMSPESLHSAMRTEIPPFDSKTNAPTRLATLGFRLVISGPSLGSLPEAAAAGEEFATEDGNRKAAADDPQAAIAILRQQTTDITVTHALDRLSATIAAGERVRADQLRVIVLSEMESATMMAEGAWTLNHIAQVQERTAALYDASDALEAAKMRALAAQRRLGSSRYIDGYMTMVRQIASYDLSAEEFPVKRRELSERGMQSQLVLLALLEKHTAALRSSAKTDRAEIVRDILSPEDLH